MPGVIGTYYFDGVSFANTTMIYSDATLTTVAPNGYYSQNGISRQLIGGPSAPVLLQPGSCVSCSVPCGSGVNGSGGTGKYTLTVDVGNSIGATIVTFDPIHVPDKCSWTYDSVTVSEYSSENYGYLQGVIGKITSGANCTLVLTNAAGSNSLTVTGASYLYDSGAGAFVNQGVPVTLGPYSNQAAGGVDLTTNAPGDCVMVIPKPNATPTTITFVIEGPCSGTAWSIATTCPALLTGFTAGTVEASQVAACASSTSTTYYNAPVNGTAGNPSVYDWIFTDANGVTKLPDGWYKSTFGGNDYALEVADGVLVAKGLCTALQQWTSSVGTTTANLVCLATINQTYYHSGAGTYPQMGDYAYSDSGGLIPLLSAATPYYRFIDISGNPINKYIIISGSVGVIAAVYTCP